MAEHCELCGSGRHTREKCNLAPLAAIMEDPDNEDEMAEELGAVLESMYPGLFDDVERPAQE